MQQVRYPDGLTPITSTLIREMILASTGGVSAVLSGFSVSRPAGIDPDKYDLSAGRAVTAQGVLVVQQDLANLSFPTGAAVYEGTLVLEGTASDTLAPRAYQIQLVEGHENSVADAVVLGWFTYPGGGIPLDVAHWTPSPRAGFSPVQGSLDDSAFYPVVEWFAPLADLQADPASDDFAAFTSRVEVGEYATARSKLRVIVENESTAGLPTYEAVGSVPLPLVRGQRLLPTSVSIRLEVQAQRDVTLLFYDNVLVGDCYTTTIDVIAGDVGNLKDVRNLPLNIDSDMAGFDEPSIMMRLSVPLAAGESLGIHHIRFHYRPFPQTL